nr:sulfatase [Allomuricauda sp.]
MLLLCLLIFCYNKMAGHQRTGDQPNFIIIYTDDLGYNDLSSFGSKLIKTPHLDNMAKEGIKLTSFYVGAPLCGPSRVSLMTGCYPLRPSIPKVDKQRKFHPILHNEEVTIAEVLKAAGYSTMAIGKWHLSGSGRQAIGGPKDATDVSQFYMKHPHLMPNAQGFDHYYGIPYSNDMGPTVMMKDNKFVEYPIDQTGLTTRYTDVAIRYIKDKKDEPFFLYLAHNMPHTPLYPAQEFKGRSAYGLYGDCVEEIDFNVGRLLQTLKEEGIDKNTFVIFTSDNGPWIEPSANRVPEARDSRKQSGTAEPLRGMKMTSWEGGFRVPCIVRYPARIKPGQVSDELVTNMDLFPTFTFLAGMDLPKNRKIDGKDMMPLLTGQTTESAHEAFYYYKYTHLDAVRNNRYKLVFARPAKPKDIGWYGRLQTELKTPMLFDLKLDMGETKDVSAQHPEIVAHLEQLAENMREDLGDKGQLGKGWRGSYRWEYENTFKE